MKLKKSATFALVFALAAGLGTRVLLAEDDDDDAKDQAKLAATAKVSKEDAQKTALAKVPNGTVSEAEIENEDGKLVWSFDIFTPAKEKMEVVVDATTGAVVSAKADKEDDDKGEKGGKDDDKD